jgi:arylsulfatase A-like enzyme
MNKEMVSMFSRTHARRLVAATAAIATLGCLAAQAGPDHSNHARHVILISVDGLHQSDLDTYVSMHPGSTLAMLVNQGASYSNARTPFPSDSFPGLTALVTGGNPKSTGVYYDDSWNRALLAPGTTDCAHATPGTEVTYFEALDLDPLALDAGYGVGDISTSTAIQQNIYKLPGHAVELINAGALPVDAATCQVVYPHSYLRVNTVFEVAKAHGLHTAWSDKHAAYDLVNGPSGAGVDDLFVPEINSTIPADLVGDGAVDDDFTKNNLNTQFYDSLKLQAVLNWAGGGNHDGSANRAGVPAVYGMNFQSVSTAQKLNRSHFIGDAGAKGLGGYTSAGTLPGTVVSGALDYIDASMGRIVAAVNARDTAIILTAKHAQSPLDRSQLRLIDDGEIINALNAAWRERSGGTAALVAFGIDDDGMLLWLSDRSEGAQQFTRNFLWNYSPLQVGGSNADGSFHDYSSAVQHAGLNRIYAGEAAARLIGVPTKDARVPDIIGIAQVGTVYSNPTKIKKIAEHGGDAFNDRHVPIVIWGAGVHSARSNDRVETTQVAPTILKLLGLPAGELQAVRLEETESLPGLD